MWGFVKKPYLFLLATTLPMFASGAIAAQPNLVEPAPAPLQGDAPTPANEEEVTFAADTLSYDSNGEIVTAAGNVRMMRQGARLRADTVQWNQKTGVVRAEGNVAIVNASNDTVYGDSVELTDTLKDGVVENLLLVLNDGGRLAAVHGVRRNEVSTLDKAVYTPCAVVDSKGCPKEPIWKISAVRVIHDPNKHRITYDGARISFLGAPILGLPVLSWVAILVVLGMGFLLTRTSFGRSAFASGGNPVAAVYAGIDIGRTRFFAFVLSGAMAGLCSYLWVSRYAVAYVDIAAGFELDSVAACVIGGISIAGGIGSVAGAVLGSLFLGVIKNALPVIGISPFAQMAISGVVIILAVVFNARAEAKKGRIILRDRVNTEVTA